MIYIVAVVFPIASMICGVITIVALVRYVAEIRRDIKGRRVQ